MAVAKTVSGAWREMQGPHALAAAWSTPELLGDLSGVIAAGQAERGWRQTSADVMQTGPKP